MTGSQFIESLDANFDDALSSKRIPATSTTLGTRTGTKTRLSLIAETRGAACAGGSANTMPATAKPIRAHAPKHTASITARMAGFLKKLSPPLPLLPERSWDFVRVSAME